MKIIKRLKIKKESLHGIIWGTEGSGLGIDIDKKTQLWFLGTKRTNPLMHIEIIKR